MSSSSCSPHLVACIAGPTGAGKTAAALLLATRWPITVINMDSRQVYADFPIITAQPSLEEQAACPHELYGFLPSTQKISAGEYARMAQKQIHTALASQRLPVLVGGTGLYMQTLFQGIAPVPPVAQDICKHWQERCKQEGSPALHEELTHIDPLYAAKIHPHDKQRITRALEVWQETGKTLSWWHAQPLPSPLFTPLSIGIGMALNELEPILRKRIDIMLANGAKEEAQQALHHSQNAQDPGWSGIGCAEMYSYLHGSISLQACIELWYKNTRAYAKRQLTWFRREKEMLWFRPEQTNDIANLVATQLDKLLP